MIHHHPSYCNKATSLNKTHAYINHIMKPTMDPHENPRENEFVIYATNKRLKIEFVLV